MVVLKGSYLALVVREYNPQTEVTTYKSNPFGTFFDKGTADNYFEKMTKQYKLKERF